MDGKMQQTKDVHRNAEELRKCSTCFEHLKPMSQCDNGHISCLPCSTKLKNKCLFCNLPIGSKRSKCVEKDVLCSCPLLGCDYVGSSKPLYKHWSNVHKDSRISFVFQEETQFILKQEEQVFYFQEEKDETLFVLHNKVGSHGNTPGLICLGSPDGTQYEFVFRASASDPDQGGRIYVRCSYVESLLNLQDIKPFIMFGPEFFPNSGQLEARLVIRRL